MTGHHNLQCTVHPLDTLDSLRFVVVCAFYQDKVLLSYHPAHEGWETQGGHIEEGETPEQAARRELYEESGVKDAELFPVCDYHGFDAEGSSNGRVFAAIVHALGTLPESEMREVRAFDSFPASLTYPYVTPVLFKKAESLVRKKTKKPAALSLKQFRNKYHLTQKELAEILKTTPTTISKYEHGEWTMNQAFIDEIKERYGEEIRMVRRNASRSKKVWRSAT